MSQYKAPIDDICFNLFDVWQLNSYWQGQNQLKDQLDTETAKAIVEEAAKICEQEIAPFSTQADQQGVKLQDGKVRVPEHYHGAYKSLCEGGWTGLSGDPAYGGMGMPKALSMMVDEMLCSADVAFSLYPGLTAGACVALLQHANDEIKSDYLPNLYCGNWSATMCLTESHAGTDLGIMRTTAKPNTNGSYQITGSKIFITAGEHDLTDNIIHLVLAKLPNAPAGSRGISLFLVPKFLPDQANNFRVRNGVTVGSIEHKMGINGSATCVLNFDNATGYLIGQPNRGLSSMFTMMNYERLSMGSQGLGVAERAYQNALAYAKDRLQGRDTETDATKAEPIIVHPDVRRMLLDIKAMNEAGRSFATWVASLLDKAKYDQCENSASIANLLTPITKAFMTDQGFSAAVTAQQIFGGHGYIKEWGMEQLVRDVRIAQIYEGTNGIQALDFMQRKVVADKGKVLKSLLLKIKDEMSANPLGETQNLIAYIDKCSDIIDLIISADTRIQNANANDFLQLISYILYGYMWYKNIAALNETNHGENFIISKKTTAEYYMRRILPKASGLIAVIQQTPSMMDTLDTDQF